MNTRISYIYRDASNYKAGSSVVVEGEINPEQIQIIASALDEGLYFIPSQVGLDDLQGQLQGYDSVDELDEDGVNPDDHPWHELHEGGFESTNDQTTVALTVSELTESFRSATWDTASAS